MTFSDLFQRRLFFPKVLLLCIILFSNIAVAQGLKVGLRFQKTSGMYWENGISTQYSFANFKPNRLFIGFDFVTSRVGTAFNSNAINQSSSLLSASWLFNKSKAYHFVARLNMGYFYSDLEEEFFKEIPHSAFLLSPELGFLYDFKDIPVSLNIGSGFYIITAEDGYSPGTLQPLYYHLDLYYRIFNNPRK
ncbi:MAG: hypothetical protein OEU76_02535 [Cyclobacteriaceae bacterium]|nr:hypothetical protein [Cyclobacteriaceae bacterium]